MWFLRKSEQMRRKSGPETDVPPGVQNVSNFFACRDCIVVNTTGSQMVGGGERWLDILNTTPTAETPELLPGGGRKDVSERQVWREGWELCFVPSAIKYSGGVGRTPAVGKWNVEGKSPETWDQFFFFRSEIFLFALVPSRCFECFYRASDARYIQESQCRKTRITFLFVWMDVTIKFLLFFIGIRWNILGCFVFFRSLLHDFAISLK